MFWTILDKERRDILPTLAEIAGDQFYLAGGTALALLLGHRDSIDFDFFTEHDFDYRELVSKIENHFKGSRINFLRSEPDTVTVFINEVIKLSFFRYNYRLLEPTILQDGLRLASLADIACMKLSAILSRSLEKDFVDIHRILKEIPLSNLIKQCQIKFPTIDPQLILKSLVYFDDIKQEEIKFTNNNIISFDTVKQDLVAKVREYMRSS